MITPDTLKLLLNNNEVIPVMFAGQQLLLDAHGVLIWPQRELLIFSDLHLEKGSFLSQFANPLPHYDSQNTLQRMRAMIERYACKNVVCLGDSLHDSNAASRMTDTDLSNLNTLVNSVDNWTWILGNHDPEIPSSILGKQSAHLQLGAFLLVHEPENLANFASVDAQIIGHFHPKSAYALGNRRISGKSFVCAADILLMPAFGKYTGGLDVKNKAYTSLFCLAQASVYLTYQHKIYLLK